MSHPPSATALSPRNFARFAHYVTQQLGIKMPDSKVTMMQSRLLRRARELQIHSLDEYSDYFFDLSHEQERDALISAITTNKTDFFREPQHFDFLVKIALPKLLKNRRPGQRMNFWSAACSSGQEPYTLAMVLEEFAAQRKGFEYAILATDVSPRVLGMGRRAIYEESLTEPVPAALRRKYLMRSKDPQASLVRIVPALREKVRFHGLNFMDEHYRLQDAFDVIFCRNVLIYFERKTQEAVITKICRHLNPGGYLFIAHSESLSGLQVPVEQITTSVFRKPTESQ